MLNLRENEIGAGKIQHLPSALRHNQVCLCLSIHTLFDAILLFAQTFTSPNLEHNKIAAIGVQHLISTECPVSHQAGTIMTEHFRHIRTKLADILSHDREMPAPRIDKRSANKTQCQVSPQTSARLTATFYCT